MYVNVGINLKILWIDITKFIQSFPLFSREWCLWENV